MIVVSSVTGPVLNESYRTFCPFCSKKAGRLLWKTGLRNRRDFVCSECGREWIVLPDEEGGRSA